MSTMIREARKAPTPPASFSDRVRGMEVNDCFRVPGSAQSVRTIVSRIRAEFEGHRGYKTRTVGASVRVWRTH